VPPADDQAISERRATRAAAPAAIRRYAVVVTSGTSTPAFVARAHSPTRLFAAMMGANRRTSAGMLAVRPNLGNRDHVQLPIAIEAHDGAGADYPDEECRRGEKAVVVLVDRDVCDHHNGGRNEPCTSRDEKRWCVGSQPGPVTQVADHPRDEIAEEAHQDRRDCGDVGESSEPFPYLRLSSSGEHLAGRAASRLRSDPTGCRAHTGRHRRRRSSPPPGARD